MAKFAANLTMLFTEVPFLERFEKAHQAGFKAVEYLFPYAFEAQELANKMEQFKASVDTALMYAKALKCKKVHAMSGIVDSRFTREQHIETFISNIRYAADKFAEQGVELMIEPLNNRDVPNYFVAHQREAVELIKQVDRPNVKLQLDLYHAQIGLAANTTQGTVLKKVLVGFVLTSNKNTYNNFSCLRNNVY